VSSSFSGDEGMDSSSSSSERIEEKCILFAAADCTGHGVPGAMVSVVCNNALNRSVREYSLTDPGEILDKTRDIVIHEFGDDDEGNEAQNDYVKDGMDIALCSLSGNTLKYAGANNPLWIIRDNELLIKKADKQPIGNFNSKMPFKTHTIELQKGDTFYLFSDGYADQFGGEKGKKFMTKAVKKLLLSIQDQSMDKKSKSLNEAFVSWRGNGEQIDDVCFIGVRIGDKRFSLS
jgi:serine phosphatase RsbU (regulator of sigma subunit)